MVLKIKKKRRILVLNALIPLLNFLLQILNAF